ncbi:MAG: hypothetical protein R3245_12500, partial [Kiloniellales bacterium]|nr:hypothetical protein [Kiloniellales bacterium]
MQRQLPSRILMILGLLILPALGTRAQSTADEARMAAAHFSTVMTSRVADSLNGPCSATTVTGTEDGELTLASLSDSTCGFGGALS